MTDMDEVNISLPYEQVMSDEDSRREFYASVQAMLAALNQVRADHSTLWFRSAGLERETEGLRKDKDRIDALEANGWDIRNSSSPIADTGDYSNAIEIVGRWMDKPHERVIGENYSENLRAALDQAMSADAYPPERPEYDFCEGALRNGNRARRRAEALGIDYDAAMAKGRAQ